MHSSPKHQTLAVFQRHQPQTENVQENIAWGHPMIEKDPQHPRLYSVNINGISLDRDRGKFDEFCQVMEEVQSDVGCIQEHNLDTVQYHIKSQLYATARHRWQWNCLTVSSTPVRFAKSNKTGGVMMISVNSLSSWMVKMSEDKWGRWTSQRYQGKHSIHVTILSVYQVVDSTAALQGNLTASSQQQALLVEANDNTTNPRQAFCRDLQAPIIS
jgi:hypothetical protein